MTNKRPDVASRQTPDLPSPEQFLATFPPEICALANQLRTLVTRTVPEVDESVYPGWHLIGYRVRDGRRSRYFCFIAPFEDRVALGFEYEVLLTNDAGLLEGTGTQVRHVTIRHVQDIREPDLAALIAEAAIVAATIKRRS